jgi:cyclase
MQRERVSENVYWFQSDIYAQVTAGVIQGPDWAVVIDTLALPEETLAMRAFIEEELRVPVRYIINTHYHADHSWGNCFFPGSAIIAHSACRQAMIEKGVSALEDARRQNPIFKNVKLVLPHITFSQGKTCLTVGKKNLILMSMPGHSPDGISVLIEEDRVLFAGDAFLPIPYVIDGDITVQEKSIRDIGSMGLENIIQGHGDIILRGEIDEAVKENLQYLDAIQKKVRAAIKKKNAAEIISRIDVESCGKNRIYLGGLAEELHRNNLIRLYRKYMAEEGLPIPTASAADEDEY